MATPSTFLAGLVKTQFSVIIYPILLEAFMHTRRNYKQSYILIAQLILFSDVINAQTGLNLY